MQGRRRRRQQTGNADAAAVAGLVAPGSVPAWLAEHRRELFPDDDFADLFPSGTGRPSVPADVVAAVLVLQALEGLSDRDAADAVRLRIDWKVACGLDLADPGFHPTVLTYWRQRVRRSERPRRIHEAVARVVEATGVLRGRRRRALDSTVVDDAVATQDTVTQLVAAVRRVRKLVPEARAVEATAHDYDANPGKPAIAWDDAAAREALVTALVRDAEAALAAVEDLGLGEAQAEAVGLLALVAGQDVEPAGRDEEGRPDGRWRIARRTAPDRVVSTVDPEARHTHKTDHAYRDGFKAHLAVEPETGLVTACALTAGNAPDGPTGLALLAGEEAGLEVLADSAYGSGEVRAALAAAGHRAVVKPMPSRRSVPDRPDSFTSADFGVDLAAGTATCPAGHAVSLSRPDRRGRRTARFERHCPGCPLRARCTAARAGKQLVVTAFEAELAAARAAAADPTRRAAYRRWRPMVERTIAWLVARGHRRVRYRGVEANQIWLDHRVAAINLRRLVRLGLTRTDGAWTLAAV